MLRGLKIMSFASEVKEELLGLKMWDVNSGLKQEEQIARLSIREAFIKTGFINDPNKDYVLPRKLRRGDTVYVVDLQRKGIISGEPDGSEFVYVQMGVMKTKMNISRLRLEESPKVTVGNSPLKKTKKNVGKVGVKVERRGKMELDIRGCACDDGVYQLDSFIDQAVMSNISTICIIHGKGTGLLRKAVHQRLKSHPSIKTFRLGVYGEGEDGVTIAELK